MYKRSYSLMILALMGLIVLIISCGGSGGGNAAPANITPTGTIVNLSVIKNYAEAKTQGNTMSFNMAGSASTGANLTGTFSFTISAPTITLTPTGTTTVNVFVQNVSVTNVSTGAFASVMSTYYYYQTGYLYKIVDDDGTVATPISQTLLPSSAKVGDFGSDMVVSYADGSTDTSTWRIDPGTNGDAEFVYAFTARDKFNVVTDTSEDSYTIKPDGSVSAVATKYYEPSTGLTITLSGNKN